MKIQDFFQAISKLSKAPPESVEITLRKLIHDANTNDDLIGLVAAGLSNHNLDHPIQKTSSFTNIDTITTSSILKAFFKLLEKLPTKYTIQILNALSVGTNTTEELLY